MLMRAVRRRDLKLRLAKLCSGSLNFRVMQYCLTTASLLLPYGYSAAELWCEAGGCDDHFYCCFASFGKSIRPKSVALTRRWTRLAELQTNDVLRSFWNVRTIYSIRGREWHCVIDELNRITLEGKLQYFMMAGRLGGNAGAFDHCIVGPRTTVSCKFGHFAESGCQYAVKMLHWCCVWTATAKTTSLVIENILTEHLIWLHLSQVSCIVSQCTNYKVTVAGLVKFAVGHVLQHFTRT